MKGPRTWLLLLHHLPARPTRLRVRVWRRLQSLGAVAVKSSAYVLPWSERTLEDFTWLQQEIQAGGGEAVLFRASSVAGATDDEVMAQFRSDRDRAYARLTSDLEALAARISTRNTGERSQVDELDDLKEEVEIMQREFDRIVDADFCEAKGRTAAAAALAGARRLLQSAQGRGPIPPARRRRGDIQDRARFQGRLWITRPRPHIDRCASAWLIRRFIDRRPRFGFAAQGGKLRRGIPFDMAGAEFGHQGEDCTFETLMKRFGLDDDPAVRAIGEIVHDIDLKDGKFGRSEAGGVNAVLRGLMEGVRDDQRLLRESRAVFDGLYATLASRPARGRRSGSGNRKE